MNDSIPATPQELLALPEAELLRGGRLLHAAGSVANADVYALATASGPVLLKTFSRRPWIVRIIFSRWTLRREFRALSALAGVAGVPTVHGIVGRDSLLTEFVPGPGPLRSHRELAPAELPTERFLLRLRELVAAIHGRGVSHGDVRRQNILQGPDESPYLIDFATAVSTRGPLPALRRLVFGAFVKADLFALAKLIRSYRPELLTAEEQRRLGEVPWHLRLGRFLRKRVYGPFIKQKRWRQRWENWRHGRFRRRRKRRA
jgi:tRNA A-37 threonylcarbamoyl transferase component Bud32